MYTSLRTRRSRTSGFTLLEVLLVVAILGIIATFAITQMNIGDTQIGVNRDATRVQVRQIAAQVNIYRLHTNRLPTSLQDLKVNPGIQGWRGPYHQTLNDAFGEPFIYTVSGTDFEVRSNAGGSEGGPISNKDP